MMYMDKNIFHYYYYYY